MIPHPVWILLLLLSSSLAHAAAPTLELLFPSGGKQGASPFVTVTGKIDVWPPPKVWTDAPGLEFKPEVEKGQFTVVIGKDVPIGPHLVRLHDTAGASELKTFVVGRYPEALEKEPNDGWQKSQVIEKLPITINGRLDKSGDVDSFTFKAEAGKWIVAMVDSYSIGAPIDAYLHLLDESGTRIALGNDSYNLDPLLAFKVEKSGTYTLQISGFVSPPQAEVRFSGSSSTIYRVSITDGPVVRAAFATTNGKVQIFGWNLESLGAAYKDGWITADRSVLTDSRVEHRLRFPVGNEPEQLEQEPNNKVEEAQAITAPCAIHGCIQAPGDEDRFAFMAKKGDRFEFRIRALADSFPLDGSLRVEDATGKQLIRDDIGVNMDDPHLVWAAQSDGKFHVAVSDLYRHGGSDYHYRLEVLRQIPTFTGRVDKNAYQLIPGKSAEIKVNVARFNSFAGKLVVSAADLPPGVTAKEVEAPDKDGEVKFTIATPIDTPPSGQPIRILVFSPGDKNATKSAVFDFRAKDSKTGDFLVNETDKIWLTVTTTNTVEVIPAAKKKKK